MSRSSVHAGQTRMDGLKLILRCDAGESIGLGHVKRCMALAEWLTEKPIFAMVDTPRGVHAEVRSAGFESLALDFAPDSQVRALAGISADAIVLDIAHSRSRMERRSLLDQVIAYGKLDRPIAFIDGVNTDALVDSGLAAAVSLCIRPYPGAKSQAYGKWLVGTEYFIVSRRHAQATGKPRTIPDLAERVLVTTGGSDIAALGPRIVRELGMYAEPKLEIRAVVGPLVSDATRRAVREAAAGSPHQVVVLEGRSNLDTEMQWCDLAVATTGLTKYELALYAVPSILISPDDHHEMNNRSFRECYTALDLGVAAALPEGAIGEACRRLLMDAPMRQELSERSCLLIDGNGALRMLAAIKSLTNAG